MSPLDTTSHLYKSLSKRAQNFILDLEAAIIKNPILLSTVEKIISGFIPAIEIDPAAKLKKRAEACLEYVMVGIILGCFTEEEIEDAIIKHLYSI